MLNALIVIWQFLSRLMNIEYDSLMNIEFDSEPVYGGNDKYIKTKINLYGDKVNTNFQGKKELKENEIIQVLLTDNARFCYCSK